MAAVETFSTFLVMLSFYLTTEYVSEGNRWIGIGKQRVLGYRTCGSTPKVSWVNFCDSSCKCSQCQHCDNLENSLELHVSSNMIDCIQAY